MTVLQFKGRNAHTSFVILEYDRRQRSTSYVQGGRHDVFLSRLVTSKTYPPSPSLSTIDRYQKPSLAALPWKIRISLVLVFHRVLQLQRANNIQFGEWPFVSVALVSRSIQQWNRTPPNSKNANFFLKVKLILFSKLYASSQFNFWSFSSQNSEKKGWL